MAPNLVIRNITADPITLESVEFFDPYKEKGGFRIQHVTSLLSNVTNSVGLTNTTTRAPVPPIPEDAQPFENRGVSVRIDPFTTVQTDVPAQLRGEGERLRLTFQVDGGNGKHQMYCPIPTTESETLKVIDGDDNGRRFTGIYLPNSSHVTLYSSAAPQSWMGKLPDDLPLSALSIPGTHNSPTCHNAPPSVRCQAVSPRDQLANGVRFFDIRVQVPEPFDPNSDKLVLVHSVFPISLTGNKHFRDLHDECRRFLTDNPTETLLISLKREGSGKGTDAQLSLILQSHYLAPETWHTDPAIPTLGSVRGKLVLIRRYNLDPTIPDARQGLDATSWADNTPDATCPAGTIRVQDFYEVAEVPSIEQKTHYVCDQLERSGCCDARAAGGGDQQQSTPIFINFLSASNFWKVGTWPEKIAARVNPAVTAWLCEKHMVGEDGGVKVGDWSTGVVVCDWVGLDGDWDLVRCVVGMNAKLLR